MDILSGHKASLTESLDSDTIENAVRTEQIRLVYRSATLGLLINIGNGLIVTLILWGHAPQNLIIIWSMALVLVAFSRLGLVRAYHLKPRSDMDSEYWGILFIVGAACAGAIWGVLGLLGALTLSLPLQVFVTFVVGGMVMGSLAMSGSFFPAYVAFLIPALIPLGLGFIVQTDSMYLAMGMLTMVFTLALYVMGHNVKESIARAIRLSMERAKLIESLSTVNEQSELSNQKLAREIQERQRMEAELRSREALYRGMFEKNQAVKLLIDPESGDIVDANPAASNFYGYPLAKLKKKNISDINTLPREHLLERMAWAKTEKQLGFEFRHRLASGETRDVEVHSGPIQVKERKLLFSIIHDISQRKRAEHALREAHEELELRVEQRTAELSATNDRLRQEIEERKRTEQALFEEKERAQVTLHSIGDAVITTDAVSKIQYLNPAAETLTGWSIDEVLGKPLETVFHLVDEHAHVIKSDPFARCLQEGRINGLPEHNILVSRTGREYAIHFSAEPIHDRKGAILGIVLAFSDISEIRRLTEQLAHQATHDALTGLVNRREFEHRLEHALQGAKSQGTKHALCYLDLDQFKLINDTAGHVAGDHLLQQITDLLSHKIRTRDTLARLGGDEFSLLLDNCPLDKATDIAKSLVDSVRDFRFIWDGRTYQIGVSIGVVPITAETENVVQLLSQADVACYTAKDQGRSQIHFYQSNDPEIARRHSEIMRASSLREALTQDRLRIFFQPIVSLSPENHDFPNYELLLRLLNFEGTLVLPEVFIPPAELYGLMYSIDQWMVDTALYRYSSDIGETTGAQISINLSGQSLSSAEFLDFVLSKLAERNVPKEKICFEIAETTAIRNLSQATKFITTLRKSGCKFALDDFGSGLCSFTHLKKLPVDYLKIDGSFIQNMIHNSSDHAIVKAINQIGHTLGIQTIAECAENETIVEQLKILGVDYAQGYAFDIPKPLGACRT